ncbi:hypothetical protein CLDAP_16170 [Caldilinea aerophila DSM 14535 = NBRC 104270]|jgi:hypothetical protein|uniref:Uncharacterized protein n=1 Tax=Caldilinea aerophila (strain DSM 14535 / JCM 11387 / NBRC 104270 / STL-6-O1) TaxID=926550 RepID=I0I319_CALAS|nr:hypothetical protein CLDAP_16170 [Caldilinea aerophila DSM 14535 = NBRC 104270]
MNNNSPPMIEAQMNAAPAFCQCFAHHDEGDILPSPLRLKILVVLAIILPFIGMSL